MREYEEVLCAERTGTQVALTKEANGKYYVHVKGSAFDECYGPYTSLRTAGDVYRDMVRDYI